MPRRRALASPASLKGVLSARDAAAALAEGLRTWADADELPVADGGEGTLDVLHAARGGTWHVAEVHDPFGRSRRARWLEWEYGTAVVEAAEAIPLDPERLDALGASSRGLGELVLAVGAPRRLIVCVGGTATMDAGVGMREVMHEVPAPATVVCDVDVPLYDAPRLFGPQKGATPEQVVELETRFRALAELQPHAAGLGAGAAGGLGAAFAALGAVCVRGAEWVLDEVGFDPAPYALVVTGEGTVDATTRRGKAPGEVCARCLRAGVPAVVFGGRVELALEGAETLALSGDPATARDDLVRLGANAERFASR